MHACMYACIHTHTHTGSQRWLAELLQVYCSSGAALLQVCCRSVAGLLQVCCSSVAGAQRRLAAQKHGLGGWQRKNGNG